MRKSPPARLLVAVAACAATMAMLASCSAASPRQTGRPGAAHPAPAAPARLSLPAPAGPYQVGTVSLHLIDRSRRNPFAASPPHRELMISIWYPAREAARYPRAPYMLPGAAAHFGAKAGQAQQLLDVPPAKVDWTTIRTSGHQGAPLARPGRPFPVVLYSPDVQDPRTLGTTLAQDLASRGYAVVTIDPTYDASEVEFPGGQIVNGQLPQLMKLMQRHSKQDLKPLQQRVLAWAKKDMTARVADTRFVLAQLAAINAGHNPDAAHRPLPRGLAGGMDLNRAGMFGESFGGMTAAQAMYENPQIKAGADLDGNDAGPDVRNNTGNLATVLRHGLNQPFMIMANPGSDHNTVPAWRPFWEHSTGWHLDLTLQGAGGDHAYSDAAPLIPQIARQLGLPHSFITRDIGTIDPARTVPAEEAYLSAFFDRWLRGRDNHLLDHPSRRYPEFTFVR
jgi:dienelactone hydrolase